MSQRTFLISDTHFCHANKLDDLRYICVSCEHINYTPILMEELIERQGYEQT